MCEFTSRKSQQRPGIRYEKSRRHPSANPHNEYPRLIVARSRAEVEVESSRPIRSTLKPGVLPDAPCPLCTSAYSSLSFTPTLQNPPSSTPTTANDHHHRRHHVVGCSQQDCAQQPLEAISLRDRDEHRQCSARSRDEHPRHARFTEAAANRLCTRGTS